MAAASGSRLSKLLHEEESLGSDPVGLRVGLTLSFLKIFPAVVNAVGLWTTLRGPKNWDATVVSKKL